MRKLGLLAPVVLALAGFVTIGGTCGTTPMEILKLEPNGMMPLENGFHYEGWAIVNGAAKSTGKFDIDANGDVVDLQGTAVPNGEFATGMDLSGATDVVISIEPPGDTDDVPSGTKYLAGVVGDHVATLTVAGSQALGDDFTGAMGTYIFATPTDEADTNELSGVWFIDLSGGTPAVGLDLPTLPSGWKYEGWAVIDGTPVTSGKFTEVDAEDDSAPYSSTEPGPPFPGEDFLVNAPPGVTFPTDLSGDAIVISIEPDPDDAAGPFTLKPLAGTAPNPAEDHSNYDMENQAADFPTMTATIK
jgi:hypothetical protein